MRADQIALLKQLPAAEIASLGPHVVADSARRVPGTSRAAASGQSPYVPLGAVRRRPGSDLPVLDVPPASAPEGKPSETIAQRPRVVGSESGARIISPELWKKTTPFVRRLPPAPVAATHSAAVAPAPAPITVTEPLGEVTRERAVVNPAPIAEPPDPGSKLPPAVAAVAGDVAETVALAPTVTGRPGHEPSELQRRAGAGPGGAGAETSPPIMRPGPAEGGSALAPQRAELPRSVPEPRAYGSREADGRAGQKRYPDADVQELTAPFRHYVSVLKRHAWKILGGVAAATIASVIITERLTPMYKATATIDINRQSPSQVVGSETGRSALADGDQFVSTQAQLVQSDAVLRPVADRFKLLDPARGEDTNARIVLKNLTVTRPPNTSLLLINYRAPDARGAAEVANAIATSYLKQTYVLHARSLTDMAGFMTGQIEELKAKMERSGAAVLQFERDLDIVNPEEKTSILSARLLKLNGEYADAQGDRIRKEASQQLVSTGSVAGAEVSAQGEALRKLSSQVEDVRQRFALAKTQYGPAHPEYQKAATDLDELQQQVARARERTRQQVEAEYQQALSRERMLREAVAQTKAEFDRLNAKSFGYQRLRREADADRTLYEELVQKIRETGINAGFQDSGIRIADPARPPTRPTSPNLPLNVFVALLCSSMLAVGVALASDFLDDSIREAAEVENLFGTPVVATVPVLKNEKLFAMAHISAARTENPSDLTPFQEAIRTLCYSILRQPGLLVQSLLVTSAAPNEGKTTISLQLAMAYAALGRQTLLIETDSRRLMGVSRKGLSDILRGGVDWRTVTVAAPGLPNLHVLPAGASLWHEWGRIDVGLADLMGRALTEYDLIIIDSPPLLGFAETLEMATVVDGVLVVASAGATSRRSLGAVLEKLARFRATVVGVVLNRARPDVDMTAYYQPVEQD